MAEVGIIHAGDVAGVWVGCDRGIVGLIAVEGSGVYLAEYPAGTPLPEGSRAPDAGGPSLPGHLVLAAARLCPLVPGRPCCRETPVRREPGDLRRSLHTPCGPAPVEGRGQGWALTGVVLAAALAVAGGAGVAWALGWWLP